MSDWLADSRSLNKFQMIVFPPPLNKIRENILNMREGGPWKRYLLSAHLPVTSVRWWGTCHLRWCAYVDWPGTQRFSHWWTISLEVIWCTLCQSYMYNIVLYLLIIYYTVYTSWLFGWAINRCHVVLIATLAVCRGESSRWCDFSGLRKGYRYLHFRSLLKNHDYDSCWWRTIAYIPALLFKAWELVRKYFGRT